MMKRFEYGIMKEPMMLSEKHLNSIAQTGRRLICIIQMQGYFYYHFEQELPDETES